MQPRALVPSWNVGKAMGRLDRECLEDFPGEDCTLGSRVARREQPILREHPLAAQSGLQRRIDAGLPMMSRSVPG